MRSLLSESDGVQGQHGLSLVGSSKRILSDEGEQRVVLHRNEPEPNERSVLDVSDSEIPAWLPQHLNNHYDVKVTGLHRPQGHNPFVLRVDRDDGPSWIARVFTKRPVERVRGDAEILQLLEDRGYPAERCASPEPVSTRGDTAVLVTEYVPGPMPTSDAASLRELGALLGRLHSLDDLAGAALRDAGSWHGDPDHEGLPREDLAGALGMLDEIAARVATPHRPRLEALRDQIASADTCDDLPRCLVHPDPGPVNAISSVGGITLVDWTAAGTGPRVVSLALLLVSALRQPRGWNPIAVDAVIAGYRQHVNLDVDEVQRLGAAMHIRALYWACYYYRMSVQSRYTPTGAEAWWPDREAIGAINTHASAVLSS